MPRALKGAENIIYLMNKVSKNKYLVNIFRKDTDDSYKKTYDEDDQKLYQISKNLIMKYSKEGLY